MAAKNQNEKIIRIMFVVAIVVLILYYVVQKNKQNQAAGDPGTAEINLDPDSSSGGGSGGSGGGSSISPWYAALAPLALLNPLAALGIGAAAYYGNNSSGGGGSAASAASGAASGAVSAAYPVRSLKSPMQKGADITEMQKSYNRVVQMRKTKGMTPSWPTISTDGVYGPNTKNAMIRLMGQDGVKLNQVLAKEKAIKLALGL